MWMPRDSAKRGKKVEFKLNDGTMLNGWLWHDYDFAKALGGYLIALDKEGRELRFLSQASCVICSLGSADEDDSITFPGDASLDEVEQLHERLRNPMLEALSKTDYNEMKRLAETYHRLHRAYNMIGWYTNAAPKVHDFFESAIQAKNEYQHLLDEIRESGLATILVREREILFRIIATNTLPYIDREIASQSPLFESYRHEDVSWLSKLRAEHHIIEEDCGEHLLSKITTEQLVEIHMYAEYRAKKFKRLSDKYKKTVTSKRLPVWPKALRLTAALGKIIIGAGFASANVGLGALAGVIATLPVLTLGSVAAVVGIATSCYTGLHAACDGLRQFADTAENDQSRKATHFRNI